MLVKELIGNTSINKIPYYEFENFIKVSDIGFCYIFRAEWKNCRISVALKSLKFNQFSDSIMINEIQILRSIGYHPHINTFYGVTEGPDNEIMIVLQYANNGNLREYLKNNFSSLQWDDKIRMAKEITQGVLYLHNKNIVHRDLHTRNILVHDEKMLIADFGLSSYSDNKPIIPSKSIVGMPAYTEPQYFLNPSYTYDKKSDIYSLGVIFWELSSGEPPFRSFTSIEAIAIHIFQGHREKHVKGTPSQYIELYERCWDVDPSKRPEAKAVLEELDHMISITSEPIDINRNKEHVSANLFESVILEHNVSYIEHNQFTEFMEIDDGISSVHKKYWQNTELTVFLKRFVVDINLDANAIQELVNKFKHLQRLSFHQNINNLYGITKDVDNQCYMTVQLFANDGNLRDYLKKNNKKLEWSNKYCIAKDIGQGLLFLHNNNIIHKNLHSRNVLIHDGRAVISDLGWEKQTAAETSASDSSRADKLPEYIDPQCFRNFEYKRDSKSDVYSYGVILWEISSGIKPFAMYRSKEAIIIRIFQGHREKPIDGTPFQYVNLYQQCWDDSPANRPEMNKVLDILDKLILSNQSDSINPLMVDEKLLNRLFEGAISTQEINYHDYNEFSEREIITKKVFSSLYNTSWKGRGIMVLECLDINEDFNKETIEEFINTLKLFQKLDFHANIIEFYGVTKDLNGYYNLVLQSVGNMNVREYLQRYFSKLTWGDKLLAAKEIAKGLEFLHGNNIPHGDVNSTNILVYDGKMIITGFHLMDLLCKRDKRTDIYNLGLILWELYSGRPPENSNSIYEGEGVVMMAHAPSQYIELYKLCCDIDPSKRPEIRTILNILDTLSNNVRNFQ